LKVKCNIVKSVNLRLFTCTTTLNARVVATIHHIDYSDFRKTLVLKDLTKWQKQVHVMMQSSMHLEII